MAEESRSVVKCPVCKTEYLPCEILIPNSFLGKAKNIRKNNEGKIEGFVGKSMDLTESYTCDRCNTTFKVKCEVKFNTSVDIEKNTAGESVTSLRRQTLFMDEN